MESASKFIEKRMSESLMTGVLKDLKDNLEGLKEDILDARELLESLETEEVLLKLIIDYTEMLQEGIQGTEDKVLEVVRKACAVGDTLDRAKGVKAKVDEFRENTRRLVEGRRAMLGSTSPNEDLNWDNASNRELERVIPGSERIIAGQFRESQISLAAMSAARIWGKTAEDKGKFSLRVFIDCLEQIVGPDVEIDTDLAERALKECSSVAHVSGDIWTEVN